MSDILKTIEDNPEAIHDLTVAQLKVAVRRLLEQREAADAFNRGTIAAHRDLVGSLGDLFQRTPEESLEDAARRIVDERDEYKGTVAELADRRVELVRERDEQWNRAEDTEARLVELYAAACPGWAGDFGNPEQLIANVVRYREGLEACIRDHEEDCVCLPEDRSVTETVGFLRKEIGRQRELLDGWEKYHDPFGSCMGRSDERVRELTAEVERLRRALKTDAQDFDELGQTRLADRARAEIDGAEARLLAALPAGGSTNASGSYIQGHPGPSEEDGATLVDEPRSLDLEISRFIVAIWSDDSTPEERGNETPEDAARFVSGLRAEVGRLKSDAKTHRSMLAWWRGYETDIEGAVIDIDHILDKPHKAPGVIIDLHAENDRLRHALKGRCQECTRDRDSATCRECPARALLEGTEDV
jgi:hypothetical protein